MVCYFIIYIIFDCASCLLSYTTQIKFNTFDSGLQTAIPVPNVENPMLFVSISGIQSSAEHSVIFTRSLQAFNSTTSNLKILPKITSINSNLSITLQIIISTQIPELEFIVFNLSQTSLSFLSHKPYNTTVRLLSYITGYSSVEGMHYLHSSRRRFIRQKADSGLTIYNYPYTTWSDWVEFTIIVVDMQIERCFAILSEIDYVVQNPIYYNIPQIPDNTYFIGISSAYSYIEKVTLISNYLLYVERSAFEYPYLIVNFNCLTVSNVTSSPTYQNTQVVVFLICMIAFGVVFFIAMIYKVYVYCQDRKSSRIFIQQEGETSCLENTESESDKRQVCCICFDSQSNRKIYPCQHSQFCEKCMKFIATNPKLRTCPMCRVKIEKIKRY